MSSRKVCDVMYDYDVVRMVLDVKELGIPLIMCKDYLNSYAVGKNMRPLLRVFVRESDLRECPTVINRIAWRDFHAMYVNGLRIAYCRNRSK
jgi:hypothetical protein